MSKSSGRALCAGLLLCLGAAAGPPLTTIQDVLYKADGSRFSGILMISWSSFEAADTSNITTQNMTVRVVDGNLRVQLVPGTNATPPVYYSVKYNSDGKIQFEETWAVPPSSQTLRVRDVRVGAPAALQPGDPPLQETDIVGLTADLAARIVKGSNFLPGRAAYISPQGTIEGVTGQASDCVRVDGSSGPCGGAANNFVDAEVPSGLVDGSNATFQLAAEPNPPASVSVFRNGILLEAGLDYTLTDKTISFLPASVPQSGDVLLASYRLAASGGDTGGIISQLSSGPQVLCSGKGIGNAGVPWSFLANCAIPAGLLSAGDRLEARFDFAHEGSAAFSIRLEWNGTTLATQTAAGSDSVVAGRADAAVSESETQWSAQSWSNATPAAMTVTKVGDGAGAAGSLSLLGTAGESDVVNVRNFMVIRYPALH